MPKDTTPDKVGTPHCPKSALRLFGDYTTLRILDALSVGELRYNELLRSTPEINPVTFCRRLRKIEEAGLLERNAETIDKQSVTYKLTDAGIAVLPIIQDIKRFAQHHPIPQI